MPAVSAVILVACIAFAPPLTDQQQRDLAGAADGGDHREQAFYALVENVRRWPSAAASAATDDGEPIHLSFDQETLIARPGDARGDLFRITGELLQISPLAPPYEEVAEWFIRERRSGEPVIVYVVGEPAPSAISERQQVEIDGRFYKSMRFTARDRQMRDYPAFVARGPRVISPAAGSMPATQPAGAVASGLSYLRLLAGPLALLIILFIVLRMWVARKPAQARQRMLHPPSDETAFFDQVDDAAGLPDDPAQALAELKRRAQQS